MAQRPQRRCSKCSQPTRNKGGRCDGCKGRASPADAAARRDYEQTPERKASNRFTSSKRWRDFRAAILAREPRCVLCLKETPDSVRPATVGHHVKSRETHPELTYEPTNVVGLCKPHHARVEQQLKQGKTIDFGRTETTTTGGTCFL